MEDVPTRAVELAHPLELDGTTHQPGAVVHLRADQGNEPFSTPNARQLVRDGRARYADDGEQVEANPPPPRSGTGSGRDAWAVWAQQGGYPVTEDMSRDDIIAAVSPGDGTSSTDSASGADTTSTTGSSAKAG